MTGLDMFNSGEPDNNKVAESRTVAVACYTLKA
jgi:hypothetical protein